MKKKKAKHLKIKFDLAKHDGQVEARTASEDRQRAGEIIIKVGKAWEQMSLRLKHKRKATPDDIKKLIADMELLVERECGHVKALESFRRFTLLLIREKAELLRLSDFNQRNVFSPADSAILDAHQAADSPEELTQAMQKPVVRYTFKERGEFELLEPVRRVLMKDGFVGLLIEENRVLAVFDDGAFNVLGQVMSGIGLEHLPSRAQYEAALEKKGNK